MTTRGTKWICARCGIPCGHWFYGWKHYSSGGMKRQTCGREPDPISREQYDELQQRQAKAKGKGLA